MKVYKNNKNCSEKMVETNIKIGSLTSLKFLALLFRAVK